MGQLAGRESDCAQIDRLPEAARDGDSGSLVVRGEAGIGKTALLAYAQVRGAHSSAVTAFVRAARLSTDPQRRTSRLAAGAHAAWAAGEPGRARGLIERALPGTSGRARARLLLLGGVIEARCGDIRAALRILLEPAAAASDPSLTLEVLGEAAETAAFAGDFETAAALGRRAATVTPGTDRDRFRPRCSPGCRRP